MGKLCGGVDIDLAKAPLKYEGLQPWEIFLSEAQERMTLAVPPENLEPFLALAGRRDVEATVLGTFTDSGQLVVRYGERLVGRLDMDFLYDGCPGMELEARWTPPVIREPAALRPGPRNRHLRALLSSLNVTSKEYKSRMYDGEVKGLSVVKPFVGVHSDVPSDATVMRVDYESPEGILLADGINPFFSDIDTYHMAASAIDEAVRRIVSAGGPLGRIALLDNFCWPDPVLSERTPDGPYKLAQLVRANKALYDLTTAYKTPCISGKDSMKNDSVRGGRKISIPPTILFSSIGITDDVRRSVTPEAKAAGDAVYVVGLTRHELGASEFHRLLARQQGTPDRFGGEVPRVDPETALRIYGAMNRATERGLLRSSHTPSLGGLAVGFALVCLGGDLGADLSLAALPRPRGAVSDDSLLFSESNSRFIVTCAPSDIPDLEELFAGVPYARVGTVNGEPRLSITGQRGRQLVHAPIKALRKAFKETLRGV
jgi:phosphoribosylformylglycinamidine synthase